VGVFLWARLRSPVATRNRSPPAALSLKPPPLTVGVFYWLAVDAAIATRNRSPPWALCRNTLGGLFVGPGRSPAALAQGAAPGLVPDAPLEIVARVNSRQLSIRQRRPPRRRRTDLDASGRWRRGHLIRRNQRKHAAAENTCCSSRRCISSGSRSPHLRPRMRAVTANSFVFRTVSA
jgi:hypothetical protein